MIVKKSRPYDKYWFKRVERKGTYGEKKTVCRYYKCKIGSLRDYLKSECNACHSRNYGPEDRDDPEYKNFYYIYYKRK